MRGNFISFIRKEFLHIFRDKWTLLIIIGMPVVQMLLFGFAISTEIRNVNIAVFDCCSDAMTQRIIDRIDRSMHFNVVESIEDRSGIDRGILSAAKIKKLDKIGMDWLSPAARKWETYFSVCEKYYKTYGNLEICSTYTDENGVSIGRWLKKQRINKAKLKTSGENGNQIKRLESIGMVWNDDKSNSSILISNNKIRSKAI